MVQPGDGSDADEVREYFADLRQSGGEWQEIRQESERRHTSPLIVVLLVLVAIKGTIKLVTWLAAQ